MADGIIFTLYLAVSIQYHANIIDVGGLLELLSPLHAGGVKVNAFAEDINHSKGPPHLGELLQDGILLLVIMVGAILALQVADPVRPSVL